MFAASLIMMLPLVWMVSASCKIEQDVFSYPIEWIPTRWNAIENYTKVILENQ